MQILNNNLLFLPPIKAHKYRPGNNRKHPLQITLINVNFFVIQGFLIHLQLFLVFAIIEVRDSHI